MKNYRFYAELPDDGRESKSGSKHYHAFTREHLRSKADRGLRNNCIAVLIDDKGQPLWHVGTDGTMDAIVPAYGANNAAVCCGCVSRDYLRKRCVRIDAELAKKLHPNLFNLVGEP